MKQKSLLFLQYLFLLAGILAPMYFLHQYILRGRTILLPRTWVDAMAIDNSDRLWLATFDGVIMIENMKITPFSIGQSEWATEVGIDENGEIWAIVGKGLIAAYSPAEIYKFDGKDWVFQKKIDSARPSRDELPCCLPNDENKVSEAQFNKYSAFLEIDYGGDRQLLLQDQHGNIWAGTRQGLVHFSSEFHPSPTFITLHIFLTSGGYWVLGIIITIVYFARLLKIGHLPNFQNYFIANGKAMISSVGYFILGFIGWSIISLFSNLFILSLFDNPYQAEIGVIGSMTVFQLFGYGLAYLAIRKNKRLIGIGIIIASVPYLVGFIMRSGCAPAGLPFPISIFSFC